MTPLSNNAIRLWRALRSLEAYGPAAAVTDATLAKACNLPARNIIDLALELLKAGQPVVASCKEPFGRFIATDVAHVQTYKDRLDKRARSIFLRRQAVARCLERMGARQMNLSELAG